MIIQCGAKRQHDIEQFRKGSSDPGVFKDSQRRFVNPGQVVVAQGPILSAWHAGLVRRAAAALKTRLRFCLSLGRVSAFGSGHLGFR